MTQDWPIRAFYFSSHRDWLSVGHMIHGRQMRSIFGNFVRTVGQESSLVVGVTLPAPGERLLENLVNKVDSKGQRRGRQILEDFICIPRSSHA